VREIWTKNGLTAIGVEMAEKASKKLEKQITTQLKAMTKNRFIVDWHGKVVRKKENVEKISFEYDRKISK